MADSTVSIKITADVMEAQAELSVLKSKLRELVQAQQQSLDSYDERSSQMTEAQRASWEAAQRNYAESSAKIKESIIGVIEKIEQLKGENLGDGLSESVARTSTALANMGQMLKTAFVYDVAFQAINKLEEALGELAHSTLEVDSSFEQLKIGIAGQLSANLNFAGSGKKVTDEQQNFNQAMLQSVGVFDKLRASSAVTGIPLEQLGKGFMGAVGPATRAGMSIQQLTEFVTKMSSVAKATSIPMNRLGSEIRDLMTGQRSQLSLEMGVTEAWIAQHKAAGDLGQAYMDMANKYVPMVAAQSQTWEAVKNNVINSIQMIEVNASKDIFAKMKEGGIDLQNSLKSSMDDITSTIKRMVDNSYDYLHALYVDFKAIFSAISPLTEGLGIAMVGAAQVIKFAVQEIALSLTQAKAGFSELWSVIKFVTNVMGQSLYLLSKEMQDVLNGDFKGAKKDWEDYKDAVVSSNKKMSDEIVATDTDMLMKVNAIYAANADKIKSVSASKSPTAAGVGGKAPSSRDDSVDKKPKGSASEMQMMEEELNKIKIAHEETIQEEIKFWTVKLGKAKEGTALYSEIVAKIASLTERMRSEAKKEIPSPFQKMVSDLNELKEARGVSLEEEAAYWSSYASTAAIGTKLRESILVKSLAAEKALNKARTEDYIRSVEENRDVLLGEISDKENLQAVSNAMGLNLPADEIKKAQEIAQEKYNIEKTALATELALVSDNETKKTAIQTKQAELEKNYNKEKTRLYIDSLKDQFQYFNQFSNSIQNSMSSALGDYINKTKSMGQAMQDLKKSVLKTAGEMVAQYISLQIMQQLKTLAIKAATSTGIIAAETTTATTTVGIHAGAEAAKTTATGVGLAVRIAMEISNAAMSIAITIGTAIKSIAVYMWQAAAAAYASAAAIPVVGWILGPAAAIVAVGAVGAMISHVASAEGGYDIPAGVNPMTQLHQNEMVLPAHIAQPLRESLKNGGVGGGGHTYNINVSAMDSRSVKSFMIDNQDALVAAMKTAHRNART